VSGGLLLFTSDVIGRVCILGLDRRRIATVCGILVIV